MTKKTVLSGIQPTGNLHLGNYLGSIVNWIDLQNQHNCLFGVMNLHAITLPQDPDLLRQNVLDAAMVYLACGLDPKKSTIFVQSEVAAHSEIAWVLGCLTPMGWLNRMTQFKDKSGTSMPSESYLSKLEEDHDGLARDFNLNKITLSESRKLSKQELISDPSRAIEIIEKAQEIIMWERHRDSSKAQANLGLYAYPVLMASDILTYHADLVPVGEDQKQHLELTRDLAGAFNRKVGREYFKLPEPLTMKQTKRIMSLQDGLSKMSKSDESDLSRINLTDLPENIVKKIKKAKTDSLAEIFYDENRPEICNLLNIFAAFSGETPQNIAKTYENAGFGKFKGDLAEIVVEKLQPIQYDIERLKKDRGFVLEILDQGKEKAGEIAQKTKREIFSLMGL